MCAPPISHGGPPTHRRMPDSFRTPLTPLVWLTPSQHAAKRPTEACSMSESSRKLGEPRNSANEPRTKSSSSGMSSRLRPAKSRHSLSTKSGGNVTRLLNDRYVWRSSSSPAHWLFVDVGSGALPSMSGAPPPAALPEQPTDVALNCGHRGCTACANSPSKSLPSSPARLGDYTAGDHFAGRR